MSTSRRADREVLAWGGAIFALFAVLVSLFAFVVAARADNGAGAVTGGTPVTLGEFTVSPEMINAPLGGTLVVTNTGSVEHNLAIDGTDLATEMLATGESATLDLGDLEAGAYTVICEVAGHKEAGMTAMLHLGGGGGGSAAAGSDPSSLRAGNDDSDALMKEPVTAYTKQLTEGANTEGVGNRPLSPKILADGTKQFDLTASIVDWEVAPGQIVKAWAYNGQVPGPWIKVGVGDRVRVVLDNRLPQSTAIHFHGIQTPLAMDGVPDVTQEPIKPGAKFAYEFVAKGPAMGMYHSHHHAEHQVPDGLAGVFQVGDPPLPPGVGPVAQEVPMVLNDAGVIGLTLNGKSFPATAPITAKVGDWVQITYLNEGAQIHPMHLHGLPQMVIGKDGFPLPAPVMMDTVTVAPGERWTVLVRATAEFLGPNGGLGVWAFHCHILNHAERSDGMFGMVTTFIVAP